MNQWPLKYTNLLLSAGFFMSLLTYPLLDIEKSPLALRKRTWSQAQPLQLRNRGRIHSTSVHLDTIR